MTHGISEHGVAPMRNKLKGVPVAILATHGFEQTELNVPKTALEAVGAEVHVISPEKGEIRGWNHTDWGESVTVDRPLDGAKADDYAALVLPGGQINPDLLRVDETAIALIQAFVDQGKPVAAICHAPWLLIEAGLVNGKRMTSYHSIKTDMVNAGADWVDEAVVHDSGFITSRNPHDLEAFCKAIVDTVADAAETRSAA